MPALSAQRSRTLLCLLITVLAVVCAQPAGARVQAPAGSACGQRQAALPAGARRGEVPLVVGDSVLYDAVPQLAQVGFEGNGVICRTFDQGLNVLRIRLRKGTLPKLVVLELGANGTVTRAQIRTALDLVGPTRRLVLLTPTDDDPPRGVDAKVMAAAAATWPTRLRVLDWAAATRAHRDWVGKDRVHLAGAAGIAGLVALIRTAKDPAAVAPVPPAGSPTGGTGAP